jgi:hypothetical protein
LKARSSKYVNINGICIYYETDGAGPPVHSRHIAAWAPQMRDFPTLSEKADHWLLRARSERPYRRASDHRYEFTLSHCWPKAQNKRFYLAQSNPGGSTFRQRSR